MVVRHDRDRFEVNASEWMYRRGDSCRVTPFVVGAHRERVSFRLTSRFRFTVVAVSLLDPVMRPTRIDSYAIRVSPLIIRVRTVLEVPTHARETISIPDHGFLESNLYLENEPIRIEVTRPQSSSRRHTYESVEEFLEVRHGKYRESLIRCSPTTLMLEETRGCQEYTKTISRTK